MKEDVYRLLQRDTSRSLIRFSIAGTTYPDRGYEIYRAAGKMACIEYIESGKGTVHIGNETFHPKAGDSYFLQADQEHHYHSDPSDPWKKHFINLSGNLLHSLTEGYGLSGIYYYEKLDLSEEFAALLALAKKENEDHTEAFILLLNRMFIKMRRHVKEGGKRESIAERTKDYLDMHVSSRFSMDDLCAHVGRSESQVIRLFKKEYGETPYGYVLRKRLSLAKHLLLETSLTVAQIAEKLSFSDEYYFSSFFKEKVGVSPSLYRKGEK